MLIGVMRGLEPIGVGDCIEMDMKGIPEIECPIDTHVRQYDEKIPTVTGIIGWIEGKCRLKSVLGYFMPYYADPLDVYYMQRGAVFHETLYQSLPEKEVDLQFITDRDVLVLGKADGFKNNSTIVELKTTGWFSLERFPLASDLLQMAFYTIMREAETLDRIKKGELYYYAWDRYVTYTFNMNFDRDKIGHLLNVYGNVYKENLNNFERDPPKLVKSPYGTVWIPEKEANEKGFTTVDLSKKEDIWQCRYCPFVMACETGVNCLKKTLRYRKPGSKEARWIQRYFTAVGYDTEYFPAMWEGVGTPDIYVVSNQDYDLKSGWEEEKESLLAVKAWSYNSSNVLKDYYG